MATKNVQDPFLPLFSLPENTLYLSISRENVKFWGKHSKEVVFIQSLKIVFGSFLSLPTFFQKKEEKSIFWPLVDWRHGVTAPWRHGVTAPWRHNVTLARCRVVVPSFRHLGQSLLRRALSGSLSNIASLCHCDSASWRHSNKASLHHSFTAA